MDFSIETTAKGGRDYTWLGSTHAINTGQPGTLDLTKFAAETNAFGIVPSGTAVGQITATKQYAPFKVGATDGTEVLAGFVLDDVNTLNSRGVTVVSNKAAFALLKQATIRRSRLPIVAQRIAITYLTPSTGQFVYAD